MHKPEENEGPTALAQSAGNLEHQEGVLFVSHPWATFCHRCGGF